ncbi:MAG: hypothetical protein Q8P53_03480 [Candidatus Shapirobacteria bacterium]|nr:hypothetical protein [Candidatus Shapirobacteria bacterium]
MDQNLENFKTQIEKQIIAVLDFLLTDNQITTERIKEISYLVLNYFDSSKNFTELNSRFNLILKNYPELASHLQQAKNSLDELAVKA